MHEFVQSDECERQQALEKDTMTDKFKPFRCAECGDTVQLKTGRGRVAEYRRGLDLPIPEKFAIPTCPSCGERYLDVERGAALQAAQAPLFAEWQRKHCAPLIDSIKHEHGVTLREIEKDAEGNGYSPLSVGASDSGHLRGIDGAWTILSILD